MSLFLNPLQHPAPHQRPADASRRRQILGIYDCAEYEAVMLVHEQMNGGKMSI